MGGGRLLVPILVEILLTLGMVLPGYAVPPTPASRAPAYLPGLGEIMGATQMRHLKLWYAGEAHSWALASYEMDELEEGLADAVRFHPTHKKAPRPLVETLPQFMQGPIQALRAAIAHQSQSEFEAGYEGLTEGCNGCHAATGFAFIHVAHPTGNPYTNQRFAPPK